MIENTDTLNLGLSSAFPSSELLLSPNTATISIIDITSEFCIVIIKYIQIGTDH